MSDTNIATLPVVTQPASRREVRVVNDPVPVLDTGRFEHMQRVATVMASCSMIPDALCKEKGDDGKPVWLPEKSILSNCFMVVNQAVRWGMDPFAVAQCVSVVHGKLCYEGKLIAAVINAKLGYDLEYKIEGQGEDMKVTVGAALDGKPIVDSEGNRKTVEGTVAEWKTTGNGSPWTPAKGGYARMLRYRGAREWCRVYAPALMLGVYSDDEMEENERRFRSARDVTPQTTSYEDRPALPPRKAPPPSDEPELVSDAPSTAPAEATTAAPANPPRKAPPPPEEPEQKQEAPQQQGQASGGMPDPKNDQMNFLLWVEENLRNITDPEELGRTWAEDVEPKVGPLWEESMAIYQRYLRGIEQRQQ